MKTVFNWMTRLAAVVSLIAAAPVVHALEDQAEVGFLRIVHAVAAGEGVARIKVDGEDIFPKGYKLGQVSGGFGLPAGSHTISIQKNGVKTGTTQVTVLNGETITLIGFAEKIVRKNEDEPPQWRARILILKQSEPERGYQMEMVSLCTPNEVSVVAETRGQAKPEVYDVKRMAVTRVNLGKSKTEVSLKVAGEALTTVEPEDPGNYVVVIYEDAAGKVKALSFYNPKFSVAG